MNPLNASDTTHKTFRYSIFRSSSVIRYVLLMSLIADGVPLISAETIAQTSYHLFSQQSVNLFGRNYQDVRWLREPVTFDYDAQWRGVFINSLKGHSICANTIGNAIVVDSHGVGNTIVLSSSQNNMNSIVSANCTFGG